MGKLNEALIEAYNKGYRVAEDGSVLNPKGKKLKLKQKREYLAFSYRYGGVSYPLVVHRLACYQVYGDAALNDDIVCRHLNGNPHDNRLVNLDIGTQSDNMMDRPAKDRIAHAIHAATHQKKKLSDRAVREIRNLADRGLKHRTIARKYGVSRSLVSKVASGTVYSNVE